MRNFFLTLATLAFILFSLTSLFGQNTPDYKPFGVWKTPAGEYFHQATSGLEFVTAIEKGSVQRDGNFYILVADATQLKNLLVAKTGKSSWKKARRAIIDAKPVPLTRGATYAWDNANDIISFVGVRNARKNGETFGNISMVGDEGGLETDNGEKFSNFCIQPFKEGDGSNSSPNLDIGDLGSSERDNTTPECNYVQTKNAQLGDDGVLYWVNISNPPSSACPPILGNPVSQSKDRDKVVGTTSNTSGQPITVNITMETPKDEGIRRVDGSNISFNDATALISQGNRWKEDETEKSAESAVRVKRTQNLGKVNDAETTNRVQELICCSQRQETGSCGCHAATAPTAPATTTTTTTTAPAQQVQVVERIVYREPTAPEAPKTRRELRRERRLARGGDPWYEDVAETAVAGTVGFFLGRVTAPRNNVVVASSGTYNPPSGNVAYSGSTGNGYGFAGDATYNAFPNSGPVSAGNVVTTYSGGNGTSWVNTQSTTGNNYSGVGGGGKVAPPTVYGANGATVSVASIMAKMK